jgi:hypothetical protein
MVHGENPEALFREALEFTAGKPGGELAAALLEVVRVADRWHREADARLIIGLGDASDEILSAIEKGLGIKSS